MVRTIFMWVRFAFTAPWSLLGWFWLILSCALSMARISTVRFESNLVLTTEWRPWFAKFWKYSTTLGRSKIFYPGARDPAVEMDERIEKHEQVHVAQVEDLMLLSFLLGLIVFARTGDFYLGMGIWVSGGAWQLVNFVTAIFRYGHLLKLPAGTRWQKVKSIIPAVVEIAYGDSEHERSAYAQTDLIADGKSWSDLRDIARSQNL